MREGASEGLERRLADFDTNAGLWQSGTGCGNIICSHQPPMVQLRLFGPVRGAMRLTYCTSFNSSTAKAKHKTFW